VTGFSPPGAGSVLPVTQRLIVRYAKRGKMRFASHRDIARAVERGVRRAALPMAYSAGFTPRPRISYAGAAPTGTASEAEYLELSLTQRCAAGEVRERLDAALPDGIDVIEVTEEPGPLAALQLEASHWEAVLPGVPVQQAAQAVNEFLACPAAEVERVTSKGTRRVDARAAVITMSARQGPGDGPGTGNAILRMAVRHVIPAVRPDDIFAALRRVAAFAPTSPPMVTRLAQGALTAVAAGAGGDPAACWPSAGGGGVDAPGNPVPQGRRMAEETVETTRPTGGTAADAGSTPAGACNQLPCGADEPVRASAPGSLTGDSPDARQRAERQRVQQ
jgi:radical SAM-linked protein